MAKFVLGHEVLLNPKPPRRGTFTYTKWIVSNARAANPDISSTDLLWAAKRVGVEDLSLLVTTARNRPPHEPVVLGPLCRMCGVSHVAEPFESVASCPYED